MHVVVNGETLQLAEQATLQDLLEQLQLAGKRVAVEVNLEVVPRSQHASHQLRPNDRIEIVHAIGGG